MRFLAYNRENWNNGKLHKINPKERTENSTRNVS